MNQRYETGGGKTSLFLEVKLLSIKEIHIRNWVQRIGYQAVIRVECLGKIYFKSLEIRKLCKGGGRVRVKGLMGEEL